MASARRRKIAEDYARRHPEQAAAERRLRIEQHKTIDRWGHKRNGTPETHENHSRAQEGAMARLYARGGIDVHQLADAHMIAAVAHRIGAELTIGTMSMETRVDRSPRMGEAFYEALGAVRAEYAYTGWRAGLPCAQPVLAMIVGDMGITAAAVRYGMTARRTRKLLIDALNAWPAHHDHARKMVEAGDLAAMHAGLM